MKPGTSLNIFIVEDDVFFGETLKYHLKLNPDFEVSLFGDARSCLNQLKQNQLPDVICIDFGLPDMTGDVLLKRIHEFNAKIPVIIISGQDDIECS